MKLRPPTYDGTDPNPLVANDWLKEVEKKLDLTTFTDDECVGAATHQLIGTARSLPSISFKEIGVSRSINR